jgi:predicted NBD/HSP70 family sugar kinase
MPLAGIDAPAEMALPDKLKLVQSLMAADDYRARKIYETIGTYLGYGIAHFADFYDLQHVLVLGRVTSGSGGDVIVDGARAVLETEFPQLARRIQVHVPDEQDKRHGQAIAAASLPALNA